MSTTLSTVGLSIRDRLDDLTLTIHGGEVTAICGPNGAGKSTLLTCLAGLQDPDIGVAALGTRVMHEIPARQRAQCIGYLPQSPEVAWDVTVEVLVGLGRLPWHDAATSRGGATSQGAATSQGCAAIDAAIATMDLEALRKRPVSRLSGGERARALMARVLATGPAWILADEPLANLDLGHAIALMRRLREQANHGRGVVLVLHDLATAMNYADRVIVLDRGRVVADGEPCHALSEAVIRQTWDCPARWLGEPGSRALALG